MQYCPSLKKNSGLTKKKEMRRPFNMSHRGQVVIEACSHPGQVVVSLTSHSTDRCIPVMRDAVVSKYQ